MKFEKLKDLGQENKNAISIKPKYFHFSVLWGYNYFQNQGMSKLIKTFHVGNVNSLLAHNLAKISQIEENSLFNHDFICISEKYFDSSVLEGDRSFQLNGYNLLKAIQSEKVFVSITKSLYVSVKRNYQT